MGRRSCVLEGQRPCRNVVGCGAFTVVSSRIVSTAWGSCGRGSRRGSVSRSTRSSAYKLGICDLGDHRATRALIAPERHPACAAGLPPRPRSRSSASLHAGLLAFGVPPRTERPPQAGRGMGMPRPAISRTLTCSRTVWVAFVGPRHARVCTSEISRGRIDRFDIPSPLCVRRITARAVHRRRLLRDGAGF